MGETEQDRVGDKVIKSEEDKGNWAGRSDNSFVVKILKWKQNSGRVKEKVNKCQAEGI